jgi:predicted ArsR family transcriptional regulator
LRLGGQPADEIAEALDLSVASARTLLTELEIAGVIECRGGVFLATVKPSRTTQ